MRLKLTIPNIFTKEDFSSTYDFFAKTWIVSKNKNLEIQICKWRPVLTLFEFYLDIRFKGRDHAGPYLNIEFFGFAIMVNLYDSRHWDDENNRWEVDQQTESM